MGSSSSTPEKPNTTENVKNLFNIEDEKEFLETLNMTDFHFDENKPSLPIIGGNGEEENRYQDVDFDLVGGAQSNDVRFLARRRRYLRHNIFKILAELDNQQRGGNAEGEEEKYLSTSSDDEAIKNIKNIILREVNKLNSSGAQSGGGCGCDSKEGEQTDEQDGGAKKRRKSKSKKQKGGDRRQKKTNDDSSSSSSSDSSSESSSEESYNAKKQVASKKNNSKLESSLRTESESEDSDNSSDNSNSDESETDESQKGGLSIFPFNSSEVKSSVSEKKNMRMIRRKI